MPLTDGSGPESDPPAEAGGRTTLSPAEFEQMTSELAQPLMAAALRLTRRRADAEDLVQETLYRAYRSLSSFEKGSRFRAWIFRILHNTWINRAKHEAMAPGAMDPNEMHVRAGEEPVPDLRAMSEFADLADEHFDERVKAAVDALPEAYRVPMVLFALGDFSYAEIAETLGIPIGTVMSRLHRARAQLRRELQDYARSQRFTAGGS